MIRSMLIALSMYSALPVPRVEWDGRPMRYTLCFFPMVGLLQGATMAAVMYFARLAALGAPMRGALGALVPLLVTGGIHMDGLMDTCDALASHAPRERMLQIMKDSHAGAFGVMGLAACLLLSAGAAGEIAFDARALWQYALCGTLSRALSALCVARLPCAKNSGLVHTFAGMADRGRVAVVCAAQAAVLMAALCCLGWAGALAVLVQLVALAWYRLMALGKFGGITGDTAGWFVCVSETAMLVALTVGQKLF